MRASSNSRCCLLMLYLTGLATGSTGMTSGLELIHKGHGRDRDGKDKAVKPNTLGH